MARRRGARPTWPRLLCSAWSAAGALRLRQPGLDLGRGPAGGPSDNLLCGYLVEGASVLVLADQPPVWASARYFQVKRDYPL